MFAVVSCLNRADLHRRADDQLRQLFDATFAECPLPRLWGLSLLGTSLRVYAGHRDVRRYGRCRATFQSHGRIHPRDFLEGGWKINILSQEGFIKMKEIVANAAALGNARMLCILI